MVGQDEVGAAPPQKSHSATWRAEKIWKGVSDVMQLAHL